MQSFEEERKEVLESVLNALAVPEPDDDRAAVCVELLRHLIRLGRAEAAGATSATSSQ